MKTILLAVLMLMACGSAYALENAQGEVVSIETTYMPTRVSFFLTNGTPSCPAGTRLYWQGDLESNKATFATVLTALTNKNKLNIYINDGDTTCRVRFLYIFS